MIERPISDVTLDDVLELRNHVQRETHTHELKGAIDIKSDKHKTMLAVQVSSFANAAGGDLILGVPEKRGTMGLEGDPDDVELRIREITRRRVDPKPPTLQVRALKCDGGRHVYVVRVLLSWTAPHMLQEQNRFYTRDGNGKRLMDRFEIERAFEEASGRESRVRAFRRERLEVLRDEARELFTDPRLMIVHVVPLQPTSLPIGETAFEHLIIQANVQGHPIFGRARTTLDGLELSEWQEGERKLLLARAIAYRAGSLEYAWTLPSRMYVVHEGRKVVALQIIKSDLDQVLRGLLGALVEYGVETPICIMASLFGLQGSITWERSNSHVFHPDHAARFTCDRDEVLLPAVTVEGDVWAEYPGAVASICEVLCQCFGETYPASG